MNTAHVSGAQQPVALVTGGNKGIGKAVVARLAEHGYLVYLASRDLARGESAAATLQGEIIPIQLDVTDPASLSRAVELIQKRSGKLDVLVNNAGLSVGNAPPSGCDLQELRATYEVNLFGVVAVTQALLPLLRAGERKTIVNLSSELGSLALHSYPDFPYDKVNLLAYNSSKTALNAFTVLLAKELRDEGFRVNSVNPGFTATDLNAFTGQRSVEQAAAVVVQYATLGPDGPTAGFFTEGGSLPW
ncbi:NADP-dependent 3-hydroxy acid dehydrogenase YdfG [Pseudomonas sp. SJZ079]|uniref:SDR family NAD(P)-dependent oxidoreductase n=1 Tax=Pseudomonas sp. SJZ079 TaxID=2572887 RepID=UPI00119C316C|nr:SDR family NAD(P)-dependent oxidoreductase [Pseudomonas sp. SJZ079]TWC31097.1 NADP-dependent 3-hydroxy acid dehydrogenase YdfG [Pseudomonas sp. SJZ079]